MPCGLGLLLNVRFRDKTGLTMQFISTSSEAEALQELAAFGTEARILAGGTDVMMQLQQSELETDVLLHIEKIPGLNVIDVNTDTQIGALCSHRQIAESAILKNYNSLRQAAAQVGGWQTQIVGTIGGNICNASPAADMLPPLLVHSTKLTLVSQSRGTRIVDLDKFLLGRRHIDREPDELLTKLTLHPMSSRARDIYIKVGRRSAMEVAIAGLAACISMAEDSTTIEDARIAMCSVGPVPARIHDVESLLRGQQINDELLDEAGDLLLKNIEPIDDIRGSLKYRQMVAPRILKHAVNICTNRG